MLMFLYPSALMHVYVTPTHLTIFKSCTCLLYSRLTGTLPNFLPSLKKLVNLDLSSNLMIGNITSLSLVDNCSSIVSLKLSSNRFSGYIGDRAFFQWLNLQSLQLSSLALVGSIPSTIGHLLNLTVLDVSNNSLSGEIPASFSNLLKLRELDLSNNRFTTSIPEYFSSFSYLEKFKVNGNGFLNSNVQFLASCSRLNYLDLSANQFSGTFHILSSSFSPAFVNISRNMFSGTLPAYQTPVWFFDCRFNSLNCPYPLLPSMFLFYRSSCVPSFTEPLIYLGCALGAALVAGLLFFICKYCISSWSQITQSSKFLAAKFTISISVGCILMCLDFISQFNMLSYLSNPIDNCIALNQHSVFSHALPFTIKPMEVNLSSVSNAPLDFTNWIQMLKTYPVESFVVPMDQSQSFADVNIFSFFPSDSDVQDDITSFSNMCNAINSCSYDPIAMRCVMTSPDLADFGGSAHKSIRWFLLSIIICKFLVEFCKLLLVLKFCYDQDWSPVRPGVAIDFVQTSPFTLFFAFLESREDLLWLFVQHTPTYADFFRRLIYEAILVSLPTLIANILYFQVVLQTGFTSVQIISFVYSSLSVPILVFRAALAWHRDQSDHLSRQDDLSGTEGNIELPHMHVNAETSEIIRGIPDVDKQSLQCPSVTPSSDVTSLQTIDEVSTGTASVSVSKEQVHIQKLQISTQMHVQ